MKLRRSGTAMKVHRAAASGWYIGQKCPGCRRTIKRGEAVFSHSGQYRWNKFAAHRSCMENVMKVAPSDKAVKMTKAEQIQAEFDELRAKLVKEHGAAV